MANCNYKVTIKDIQNKYRFKIFCATDLSNYYNKNQTDALLDEKQNKINQGHKLDADLVDDTNSTNKFVTSAEKTAWNNKYDKPSGGIPKTDLSSDVQTSLEKADTAIQDVSGKEDKSNKVTSLSSSSTDEQYPSAKSVYDSQASQDNLITQLQTENEYLNSVIEQAFDEITGTGTQVTLDDTIQARMNIVLEPSELSQDSTPTPSSPQDIHTITGDNTIKVENKNYLDLTKHTNTLDSNTTILSPNSCQCVVTGNWQGAIIVPLPLEKNTDYTISAKVGSNATRCIVDSIKGYNDGVATNIVNNQYYDYFKNGYTFNSGDYDSYDLYFHIAGNSSPTGTLVLEELQIEKGTSKTNFVPYETPQTQIIPLGDIEYGYIGNYKDRIFKTSGKNLFDGSLGGETGKYLSNQGVVSTGNANLRYTDYIKVDASKQSLVVSGMVDTMNAPSICFYNSSKEFISGVAFASATTLNVNIPSNAEYFRCSYRTTNPYTMINYGSTALDYEPYGTGKWYIKKNIGKVVLDGSETGWSYYNVTQGSLFRLTFTGYVKNETNYCNYFLGVKNSSLRANNTIYLREDANNAIDIIDNDYTSADDFKTWLSTHNTIVYYVLSTPTYTLLNNTLQTALDNAEKLLSYKGQTNVFQVNTDLPFVITGNALGKITA